MTTLPENRRILTGRTWGRSWSPADYDPIRVYRNPSRAERIYGVILAVVIGIVSAVALAHFWSN